MDICIYHVISNPMTQVHHLDHVNLQSTGQQKGIWGVGKMETESRYQLRHKTLELRDKYRSVIL